MKKRVEKDHAMIDINTKILKNKIVKRKKVIWVKYFQFKDALETDKTVNVI